MPLALYALAIGGFGIGLTEFIILGLLPEVAHDFGVTETTAGYLISGYALSVAIGAIVITVALTRVDRKKALLGLTVLFILGNALCALAPNYQMLMAGRIVAALCHGAFFGIGSVVAAGLVAENKKSAAIAIMFTGLTTANVLGVPLGTFLGQAAGWRSTFWAITAIGVLSFVSISLLIPATKPSPTSNILGEFRVFRSHQVWMSIVVTILGFGGMFGAFSYIAYTLTGVSGFATETVPWLLVVFGVGLFVGNLAGGRGADKNLAGTLIVVLGTLTVVLVVFAVVAGNQFATILALVLMGGFGFATVPGLQMRIMNHATDTPTLASGANIAAFNVGNALGAWIGGLAIAAGFGYTSPLISGAAMTLLSLIAIVVAENVRGGQFALSRRVRNRPSAMLSSRSAESTPGLVQDAPTCIRGQ